MADGAAPPAPDAALLDRFAPYYDLEYGAYDADLDFYRAWATRVAPGPGRPARVLDLACGTGRVLLALAAAGHTGSGVDAAPAMLARAQAHAVAAGTAGLVRFALAPMQALPGDLGMFDLAFCALNSFAYLPNLPAQLAMLAGVRAHLAPAGALLLDLTPVDAAGPYPANGELVHQGTWPRPDGGAVAKFVAGHWDPAAQQHDVTWIYDEVDAAGQVRRTLLPQRLRYTHRWEAQLLLERAGFARLGVYGDYDGAPFAAGAPRLILAARPAAPDSPAATASTRPAL